MSNNSRRVNSAFLACLLLGLTLASAACTPNNSVGNLPGGCTPTCNSVTCGMPDNCGGLCGCGAGMECNQQGQCIGQSSCTQTCMASGWECGSVCGSLCGVCADGQSCSQGHCFAPTVNGCPDCSIRLSIIEGKLALANGTQQLVIAIDYQPSETEPRPRLLDLRIRPSSPVVLANASAGDAVLAAGKQLYVDPRTLNPWKERTDGTYQLLVMSVDNLNVLGAGRIATMSFSVDTSVPVSFSLVKREQTLAPAEADAAIATSPYDTPVGFVQH